MHIVIEGQDATGKDTQAALLADYLKSKGQNVVAYAESGTNSKDPFIKEIAKLTYGSTTDNIDHRTRVLLYLVNRYEQWRTLAEPVLKQGGTVITTRNWFSTLIYEGYGAGVSRSLITKIHKEVMPESYFHPDKIAILTLSEAERAKRLSTQDAQRSGEIWKSKPNAFQQKINHSYLTVAKNFKIPTMDTSGTVEEVHQRLLKFFNL